MSSSCSLTVDAPNYLVHVGIGLIRRRVHPTIVPFMFLSIHLIQSCQSNTTLASTMLHLLFHLAGLSSVSAYIIRSTLPERSLLITSETSSTPCLAESYYGSYGGSKDKTEHIYLPTEQCTRDLTVSGLLDDGLLAGVPSGDGRLVWVGMAGVDPTLVKLDMEDSWLGIQSLAQSLTLNSDSQHAFSIQAESGSISLIKQSESSLLLHVPNAMVPILDTLLPAHLVPVALPHKPFPAVTTTEWAAVPRHLAEHLGNLTKHLRFDPLLGQVLDSGIQMNNIRKDVRWLTGEGPSGIESRHSFTAGAIKASNWIKGRFFTLVEDSHLVYEERMLIGSL